MESKNLREITKKEAKELVKKGFAKYRNPGNYEKNILSYNGKFYAEREATYEILSDNWIN